MAKSVKHCNKKKATEESRLLELRENTLKEIGVDLSTVPDTFVK